MNKHLIALAVAATALQGCANQTPPAQVAGYNYDEGIAKTCTASPIDLSAGTSASASLAMTNDGWCAARAVEKDGKPFKFGLLRARPEHGVVLIRQLGGQTRMEYTADARYVGPDRFTVALVSKTANVPDATVQVSVTVAMGENMAPPPATAPAARTPARPAPATRRTAPAR